VHGAAHRAHIPDAQGLPWWSLGVAQRVGHPATTIVVVTVVMVFVAVATTHDHHGMPLLWLAAVTVLSLQGHPLCLMVARDVSERLAWAL
jgi:hypothetical protein